MSDIPVKVGAIGIGLGGTNLALKIADQFKTPQIGLINLSEQDLNTAINVPKERQLHLGEKGVTFGAGKDREKGANHFVQENEKMTDWAKNLFPDVEILFVCFSTSGGTGSGIGPRLAALLGASKVFLNRSGRPPIVFGIAAAPDSSEGIRSLVNTVGALDEINKFCAKGVGRFFIVDNNFSSKNDLKDRYAEINETVAVHLHRYITQYGSSRYGCLDREDRFTALQIPGLHSLVTINGDFKSPLVYPHGARVKMLLSEISEEQYNTFQSTLTALGVDIDDKIHGFYESGLSPIVHLSGFTNLGKIAEQYRNRLQSLKERAASSTKEDAKGRGLVDVGQEGEWVDGQYRPQKVNGFEDIMDLLQ